jgi:hypothetical protein
VGWVSYGAWGALGKECFSDTGGITGDSGQASAVIGSSGKRLGTRINTGAQALHRQPQLSAVNGFPATVNRRVVGSSPTSGAIPFN